MKVVVTGAAGFLGARVADALLAASAPLGVAAGELQLVLVDVKAPAPRADTRARVLARDLCEPGAAEELVAGTDVLLHLAAVVSGHAEEDFDLGMRVNLDATRALLEAARLRAPALRFVLASTSGVFGALPADEPVRDRTAATPQTSYGCAKAMSELLVNDYARRGFADARAVRLPTVSVRAGAANRAVTSYASGVVREPLHGAPHVCPVPAEQALWLCSPAAAVRNLLHAAELPAHALGEWRVVALPGLTVTAGEMVAALRAVAGERAAALVRFELDPVISAMVASFPSRFDASRALQLGFVADTSFEDIIRAYIRDDLQSATDRV